MRNKISSFVKIFGQYKIGMLTKMDLVEEMIRIFI